MDMNMFVVVNTKVPDFIHCWPEAPVDVAFLRNPHRHELHVTVDIEVHHDDREVEIIMLKRYIDNWFRATNFELRTSCETVAAKLCDCLTARYGYRAMRITILEDGENGAKFERP